MDAYRAGRERLSAWISTIDEMAQYPSLATLRSVLTAQDPDDRGEAYGAVYEAGVNPSDVLGVEPSDETVDTLVESGVIPKDSAEDYRDAAEYRQETVGLLEEIRDILEAQ